MVLFNLGLKNVNTFHCRLFYKYFSKTISCGYVHVFKLTEMGSNFWQFLSNSC